MLLLKAKSAIYSVVLSIRISSSTLDRILARQITWIQEECHASLTHKSIDNKHWNTLASVVQMFCSYFILPTGFVNFKYLNSTLIWLLIVLHLARQLHHHWGISPMLNITFHTLKCSHKPSTDQAYFSQWGFVGAVWREDLPRIRPPGLLQGL